ncbi:divergent PAP2 family protein [Candidatus Saccharibacteria bacterium]|nr:divergent PAP2 family protein [Candidatus Saccharibacteria bacterium]
MEEYFNYVLICAILGWVIAQIIKTAIASVKERRVRIRENILASGGWPSAHSTAVAALATAIAKSDGVQSSLFAVAAIFALLVMYDAMNVRRAAGSHAKILNRTNSKYKLKERLGHTPAEVAAGAVLGVIIPFLVPLSTV